MSRWRGGFRRLVLAPPGLTGLLNPCVKSGTKLFQPYLVNYFNCVSPARARALVAAASASSPEVKAIPPAPCCGVQSCEIFATLGKSFRSSDEEARALDDPRLAGWKPKAPPRVLFRRGKSTRVRSMKDELTTILEAMRAAQAEVADYLVSADRNAELTMALTTSRRSRNPQAR